MNEVGVALDRMVRFPVPFSNLVPYLPGGMIGLRWCRRRSCCRNEKTDRAVSFGRMTGTGESNCRSYPADKFVFLSLFAGSSVCERCAALACNPHWISRIFVKLFALRSGFRDTTHVKVKFGDLSGEVLYEA